MNTLDHFDKEILKELQKDSAISNANLAKKIGLSPSACLSRTKQLNEKGIIKAYVTELDESKLGFEITAIVLVNLSPLNRENIHSFLESVEKYPQIQECYTLTGNHDYMLKIIAKNMEDYHNFIIDSLMHNNAISGVETNLIMNTEKRTTNIPIDDIV